MTELLKHCRYYKGEENCPKEITDQDQQMIWFYEQKWVQVEYLRDEGGDNVQEYLAYVQPPELVPGDQTPPSLTALLFNRFSKYSYSCSDVDSFRNWYRETYLGIKKSSIDNDR